MCRAACYQPEQCDNYIDPEGYIGLDPCLLCGLWGCHQNLATDAMHERNSLEHNVSRLTQQFFSLHQWDFKKKHTVISHCCYLEASVLLLKIPHSQLGFEDSKAAEAGKGRCRRVLTVFLAYQQMIVIGGHRTVCKAWHPCVSNFYIDSI